MWGGCVGGQGSDHHFRRTLQMSILLTVSIIATACPSTLIEVRAARGNSLAGGLGGGQTRDEVAAFADLDARLLEVPTERFRGAAQMLG